MAKGISLHVGLNSVDPAHYQGWSGPLNACEADAEDMERICSGQGFQTQRILTSAATRKAVTDAISNAAAQLASGDIFLISYSGHGGQLPDLNGEEDDSLDETWCLYDGELLDDELYTLWAKFAAGVRIVVFSDSCHSGSVIRVALRAGIASPAGYASAAPAPAAGPSFRIMPPDAQLRTYVANRTMYDALLRKPAPPPRPKATVILVSGCQDNQLSMDGPFNGAFTGALISTWRGGAFKGSYSALTKEIRRKLPSTQSPNYMVVGRANPAFEKEPAFTVTPRRRGSAGPKAGSRSTAA